MKPSRPLAPLFSFALLAAALAAPALARDPLLPNAPQSGVVSDNEFLRRASAASAAESQMGTLAVSLSVDADVRRQAGTVVADQTRNRDNLTTLAKSKSIDLPTTNESAYQVAIDDLRNLEGRDFDVAYLKTLRTDQEMIVDLFQGAATHATDPDVREYATNTLPLMQAHLAKTQQLEIKRQ